MSSDPATGLYCPLLGSHVGENKYFPAISILEAERWSLLHPVQVPGLASTPEQDARDILELFGVP